MSTQVIPGPSITSALDSVKRGEKTMDEVIHEMAREFPEDHPHWSQPHSLHKNLDDAVVAALQTHYPAADCDGHTAANVALWLALADHYAAHQQASKKFRREPYWLLTKAREERMKAEESLWDWLEFRVRLWFEDSMLGWRAYYLREGGRPELAAMYRAAEDAASINATAATDKIAEIRQQLAAAQVAEEEEAAHMPEDEEARHANYLATVGT